MIIPGLLVYDWPKPNCLECGHLASNLLPPTSAFIRYACRNSECAMHGISVTVEKVSATVFTVDCMWKDGKPAYPADLRTVEPTK